MHLLEGLLIALEQPRRGHRAHPRRRAIATRRAQGSIERYELTHIQAQAILDLRLQQLTALEADAIRREHADKLERIRELRALLGDEDKVLGLIKEELSEIAEPLRRRPAHGDHVLRGRARHRGPDRRPADGHRDHEVGLHQVPAPGDLPPAAPRRRRRGGHGHQGRTTTSSTSSSARRTTTCSSSPTAARSTARRSTSCRRPRAPRAGRYLGNVLPLREGERVQSVLSTRDFSESQYLVFATRNGIVKKTEFGAYNTPIKADGIIAINIRDDDELVAVRRVSAGDHIIMVARTGRAATFAEDAVRAMGRDTSGVRGMNVDQPGNAVLAMDVARRRPGAARRHRERLRQAHADRRVPRQGPRLDGRQDDLSSPRPRGRSAARSWCASTRSSCSSRRTAWCSEPRCAASTATGGRRRACG